MSSTIATNKMTLPTRASDAQWHSILSNHRTQSATAIDGWASVIFGVPFMAVGFFMEKVSFDKLQSQNPGHDPIWLMAIIAGMFLFGGLFFFVHGIRGVAHKAAYRREAAKRPNEPWLYDHHWRREGTSFSAFDDMLKRLLAAMFWNIFLVPFGWVGFHGRGTWPFLVVVAIFGLLGLIFWVRWARMLFDFLRYGNSFLAYEEFPFALGGSLRARLRSPHHVSEMEQLTLTLRCVQEEYVTSGTGQNRTTSVVCYELYSDIATYDRDRLTGLAGNDIPIEFRVPADQPTTNLSATPPIYWEIEANGKARGADYEAVFLVPVYKAS